MIHLQVVYRVSASRTNDANSRVRAFVEDLKRFPAHFRDYRIYQYAHDASTLVHIISFPDRKEQLRHTESEHVKNFVEDMIPFCVEGPLYTDLEEIALIGPALEVPPET